MKLRNKILIMALLLCVWVGSCSFFGSFSESEMVYSPHAYNYDHNSYPVEQLTASAAFEVYEFYDEIQPDFRAVWVTSVINLDSPSRQDMSAEELKREIDSIIARTLDLGLNAIIFQVRPTGDAFYQSDIFPWSHWLSGTQGEGIPDFDPLEYWIEVSHANGLELHAWINPYRIIHTITNSSDPNTLAPNNPVRLRPELAVGWTDTNGRNGLFLDPGIPDARQLIIDGIEELIRNYNVDGIHFDDYFYPGSNFDDAATFKRYGNGMTLSDWRRENVNTLIRDIQSLIRTLNDELNRDVRWGISPTAIWKNESSDPLGVPTTRGMESYHSLYADTRLWVTEEWVDYINPQIYWYIGFEIADFEAVLNWWIDLCCGTNVDLYIGHAAWREVDDHQSPRWRGEMVRQLEMIRESDVVKGSVFFRAAFLECAVGDAIGNFFREVDMSRRQRQPVMVIDTLSVGTPGQNARFTAASGAGLSVNVTGVSNPSRPLFLNGEEVTARTVEGFFFVHVPLEPGNNEFIFTQVGMTPVVHNLIRAIPEAAATPAPASRITQVTYPKYATVTSSTAWVFPRNTSTGGSDWMLSQGQRDRVVAESTNDFVRLSSGMWIRRDNVTINTQDDFIQNVLKNGEYHIGEHYDMIVWQADVFAGVYTHFDGRVLTVRYGIHTEAPPINLPDDLSETIFAEVTSGINDGTPYHAFTIRDDVRFEGQYVTYEDGEFRLHLRKRRTLVEGEYPLRGFTFILDAGHGGDEYGAIGPLGAALPEKEIALINSQKLYERLIALGASVYMTRTRDVSVSVQQRVNLSRSVKPDLFISLHVNSVAETTNAANIRGFTVWYRNPGSVEFANAVLEHMHDVNPRTTRYRSVNQANFYVCRPQWAPHVLLESGFIVNIDDFAWLIDPVEQNRMADATVETILAYFG